MDRNSFGTLIAGLLIAMIAAVAPVRAETLQIVGFGDSLMAGYQLPQSDAFPAQLEAALKERGNDVKIINAGVSGDTTSAGLARLDWAVPEGTDGVILELGANDALRGIAPEITRENLDAMIARLEERGIPVLLAGMMAPPNMGREYADRFNRIFADLAEKRDTPLYPFFLDGIAAQSELNLDDGMHPNAQGVAVMVDRFLPIAEDFVASIRDDRES